MWDLIVSVPDHCLSFYLTKPEAMIHNEQARNNYPNTESFTKH